MNVTNTSCENKMGLAKESKKDRGLRLLPLDKLLVYKQLCGYHEKHGNHGQRRRPGGVSFHEKLSGILLMVIFSLIHGVRGDLPWSASTIAPRWHYNYRRMYTSSPQPPPPTTSPQPHYNYRRMYTSSPPPPMPSYPSLPFYAGGNRESEIRYRGRKDCKYFRVPTN